jgi:hypothetical protein
LDIANTCWTLLYIFDKKASKDLGFQLAPQETAAPTTFNLCSTYSSSQVMSATTGSRGGGREVFLHALLEAVCVRREEELDPPEDIQCNGSESSFSRSKRQFGEKERASEFLPGLE